MTLHRLVVGLRFERVLVPHCDDPVVGHRLRRLEDPGERVVIGGRDRVELMVVATRAADCQTHEDATNRVDLFVDDVHFHLQRIVLGEHLRPDHKEAGGGEPVVVDGFVPGFRKQVACDLLLEKLVVGFVGVERLDHVVAILIGIGVGHVFIHAVRVGISRQVEPVPSPALAVARRREEAIDHPAEGFGGFILEERLDFLGSWRQADEVERGAADQGSLLGLGGGGEAFRLKTGEDETVDRRARPTGGLDLRGDRIADRLKCPKCLAGFE